MPAKGITAQGTNRYKGLHVQYKSDPLSLAFDFVKRMKKGEHNIFTAPCRQVIPSTTVSLSGNYNWLGGPFKRFF